MNSIDKELMTLLTLSLHTYTFVLFMAGIPHSDIDIHMVHIHVLLGRWGVRVRAPTVVHSPS